MPFIPLVSGEDFVVDYINTGSDPRAGNWDSSSMCGNIRRWSVGLSGLCQRVLTSFNEYKMLEP